MGGALRLVSTVIGVALGLAVLGPAASAEDYKIGFVNVARVLEQSPQAEEARGRIELEFEPRDRTLLAEQQKIRDSEDKLARDGEKMSDAERAKLERDLRALRRELRRVQEEFREDLSLRRSQELSQLQTEVNEVIQGFARSERFDLIMSDGVVFYGERVDITDEILSRLKTQFETRPRTDGAKAKQ